MVSSEDVFEMARRQTQQKLARALYEWDNIDTAPFETLNSALRDSYLHQADFLLARFNIHGK